MGTFLRRMPPAQRLEAAGELDGWLQGPQEDQELGLGEQQVEQQAGSGGGEEEDEEALPLMVVSSRGVRWLGGPAQRWPWLSLLASKKPELLCPCCLLLLLHPQVQHRLQCRIAHLSADRPPGARLAASLDAELAACGWLDGTSLLHGCSVAVVGLLPAEQTQQAGCSRGQRLFPGGTRGVSVGWGWWMPLRSSRASVVSNGLHLVNRSPQSCGSPMPRAGLAPLQATAARLRAPLLQATLCNLRAIAAAHGATVTSAVDSCTTHLVVAGGSCNNRSSSSGGVAAAGVSAEALLTAVNQQCGGTEAVAALHQCLQAGKLVIVWASWLEACADGVEEVGGAAQLPAPECAHALPLAYWADWPNQHFIPAGWEAAAAAAAATGAAGEPQAADAGHASQPASGRTAVAAPPAGQVAGLARSGSGMRARAGHATEAAAPMAALLEELSQQDASALLPTSQETSLSAAARPVGSRRGGTATCSGKRPAARGAVVPGLPLDRASGTLAVPAPVVAAGATAAAAAAGVAGLTAGAASELAAPATKRSRVASSRAAPQPERCTAAAAAVPPPAAAVSMAAVDVPPAGTALSGRSGASATPSLCDLLFGNGSKLAAATAAGGSGSGCSGGPALPATQPAVAPTPLAAASWASMASGASVAAPLTGGSSLLGLLSSQVASKTSTASLLPGAGAAGAAAADPAAQQQQHHHQQQGVAGLPAAADLVSSFCPARRSLRQQLPAVKEAASRSVLWDDI